MIDWPHLRQLQEDVGAEDFAEVIDLFTAEMDAAIADVRGGGDPGGMEETLHFLKGSALNLGFRDLADLCGQGEDMARAGRADGFDMTKIAPLYDASKDVFLANLARELGVTWSVPDTL